MANNRTGSSRGYRGQPGGAHTRPWREDPLIQERITLVRKLHIQRNSALDILPVVNKWLEERQELPIQLQTIYTDLRHIQELRKEEAEEARQAEVQDLQERIDGLKEVIATSWRAFRALGGQSMNRSQYMSTIRQAEMDIAKLQRLLDRNVTLEGEVGDEPISFTLKLSDA